MKNKHLFQIITILISLMVSITVFAGGETELASKAIKLKFNGVAYLGYEFNMPEGDDSINSGQFTIRRNYFQVKAA